MSLHHLPPVQWIDTTDALRDLIHVLHQQPLIGLDTESNSLYAYQERICLIQLSDTAGDYIIDPLAIDDMRPLGDLLADPTIEIIIHAAEYDLVSLQRDFGFRVGRLFDTMQAARILGRPKVGLSYLLGEFFDVTVDKRYQRADWGQRPIPQQQLRYAQIDTHYLIPLRDRFHEALFEQGSLAEAREIFSEELQFEPRLSGFDPDGFWKFAGARRLKGHQLARLRELYLWRERVAEQKDVPVFKVLANETLVKLARAKPTAPHHLTKRGLLSKKEAGMHGKAILAALRRGNEAAPPQPPPRPHADYLLIDRQDRLKAWRKDRAAARGVASDIILPRDTLWEIAKSAPRTLSELASQTPLGPWRLQTYGQEILQVLAEERDGIT